MRCFRKGAWSSSYPGWTSHRVRDSNVETRYAQIEKELLAVIFGLEKFHTYTCGRKVTIESDHKPLEVILKKLLHKTPKLSTHANSSTLLDQHDVPERNYYMYLIDTLSRASLPNDGKHDVATEIESINAVQDICITTNTLHEIKDHTEKDAVLQELKKVVQVG